MSPARHSARSLIKPAKPAEVAAAIAALLRMTIPTKPPPTDNAARTALTPPNARCTSSWSTSGPVNQEVAAGLLGLRGHTVEIAGDGLEAVEAFERGRSTSSSWTSRCPTWTASRPRANIRELEECSRYTRTPIYAMSAHVLKGFTDRCLEAGMDGYVTKPICPDELFAVTQKISATLAIQHA